MNEMITKMIVLYEWQKTNKTKKTPFLSSALTHKSSLRAIHVHQVSNTIFIIN